MVMVSMELAPSMIGLGEKFLLTLTPGRLVSEAAAAAVLLAPLDVVTAPIGIVFVRVPFTFVIALRVRSQLFVAAKLPPLNENELSPEFPVIVPPQVPVFRFAGAAIDIPAGRESVKAIPVRAALLGLVSVTSRTEEEPPYTSRGAKLLFTVIVKAVIVRLAVAGASG